MFAGRRPTGLHKMSHFFPSKKDPTRGESGSGPEG